MTRKRVIAAALILGVAAAGIVIYLDRRRNDMSLTSMEVRHQLGCARGGFDYAIRFFDQRFCVSYLHYYWGTGAIGGVYETYVDGNTGMGGIHPWLMERETIHLTVQQQLKLSPNDLLIKPYRYSDGSLPKEKPTLRNLHITPLRLL